MLNCKELANKIYEEAMEEINQIASTKKEKSSAIENIIDNIACGLINFKKITFSDIDDVYDNLETIVNTNANKLTSKDDILVIFDDIASEDYIKIMRKHASKSWSHFPATKELIQYYDQDDVVAALLTPIEGRPIAITAIVKNMSQVPLSLLSKKIKEVNYGNMCDLTHIVFVANEKHVSRFGAIRFLTNTMLRLKSMAPDRRIAITDLIMVKDLKKLEDGNKKYYKHFKNEKKLDLSIENLFLIFYRDYLYKYTPQSDIEEGCIAIPIDRVAVCPRSTEAEMNRYWTLKIYPYIEQVFREKLISVSSYHDVLSKVDRICLGIDRCKSFEYIINFENSDKVKYHIIKVKDQIIILLHHHFANFLTFLNEVDVRFKKYNQYELESQLHDLTEQALSSATVRPDAVGTNKDTKALLKELFIDYLGALRTSDKIDDRTIQNIFANTPQEFNLELDRAIQDIYENAHKNLRMSFL